MYQASPEAVVTAKRATLGLRYAAYKTWLADLRAEGLVPQELKSKRLLFKTIFSIWE